jgi:DNA-binding NarL/FixJ family response regulator
MIAVALVEAEALMREALKGVINAGDKVSIVADAATASGLLTGPPRPSVDVVVLSLASLAPG